MPRDRSRPRSLIGTAGLGLVLSAALLAPELGRAAPPDDDWTLETRKDDEKLINQRFAKLKANPFDSKQWKALEKALGKKGLIRKIEAAATRSPDNVALQILQAQGELDEGDPSAAAARLEALEGKAGRWEKRVFDLRIDALESAKSWADAIDTLEAAAKDRPKDAVRLLERAYKLADRGSMHERALEVAEALAKLSPKDVDATVRVARAARSAGEDRKSDDAYAAAIARAKGDRRNDLAAERARARLDAGDIAEAAQMLWDLLDDAGRGRPDQREGWWEDLETCYRKQAQSEVLVEELEKWLEDGRHGKEVAAWHALARAQKAAGLNPIPALQKAIELAPRDTVARAALIEALEEQGESEAALEQYRELRGKSAEEVRLGLEMAERLITNGEGDTGLEIAAEIRQNGARNSDTLLLLIEFYNNVDERDLALETARALVKVRGSSPEARVALGEQLWEMGHRKEALEQWEKLPKLIKPAHKGWYRHAEILADHANMERNLREVALESLEKALKKQPNEPMYLRLQAMLEEERNRPDLALDIWEKVRQVADAPEHELLRAEARTRIVELLAGPLPAKAEKRAKALSRAEADLAAGPSPEALEAGLFLAELYSREENYAGAVRMYTKLRDMFPNDPDRLMELAVAQRRAGQAREAVATLERLLPLSPAREVDVLVMLTELSHELDKPEEARQAAVRALEEGSSGIRALLRLGELSERRGDIDQAMWCYQTVLEAHPEHARTRVRLAELQLTIGDIEGAAKSFRDLLEAGGPADLMREAGARALDLAEVTGTTGEVLELAVRRTKREPNADEPRDFLLATLDRVEPGEVESWLTAGEGAQRDANRVAALRRPLVAALSRGSINNRMTAAQHLGRLALPDTAIHLARTGANLQPPRDATHAVRQRFIAARVAATEAAGELDDPASIPVMAEIVGDRSVDGQVRAAAFWALARSTSTEAAAPLRERIRARDDEIAITLACLGLARLSRDDKRVEDLVVIDRLARDSSVPVRRACTFAAAALTPDFRVVRLHPQLHDPDPFIAAVAAWRIGQVDPKRLREDSVEALFGLYFGPGGLPRDAAIASLDRLLREDPAAGGVGLPPVPRSRNWDTIVERWLVEHLAPASEALAPEALDGHREPLLAAWKRSMEGTRAELAAATRAARACGEPPPEVFDKLEPRQLCLEPLVEGTVAIGG